MVRGASDDFRFSVSKTPPFDSAALRAALPHAALLPLLSGEVTSAASRASSARDRRNVLSASRQAFSQLPKSPDAGDAENPALDAAGVRSATELPGTRPKHVCKASRSSPAEDLRLKRKRRKRKCQNGCADSVARSGATIPSARDEAWKPRAKPRSRVGGANDVSNASAYLFPVRRAGTAEATADAGSRCDGFVGRDIANGNRTNYVRARKNEMLAPRTTTRGTLSSRCSPPARGGGRLAINLDKATPVTLLPAPLPSGSRRVLAPIRGDLRRRFRERDLSPGVRIFVTRLPGAVEKEVERNRIRARRTPSCADAGRTAHHARAARGRRGRTLSLDISVRAPPIPGSSSGRVFPSAHC